MSIFSQLALSEYQLDQLAEVRRNSGGVGYGLKSSRKVQTRSGVDIAILKGAHLGSCSHDTHSGE